MFKVAVILFLTCAVFAGRKKHHKGSGDDDEPFHVADFKEEMTEFVDHVMQGVEGIHYVEGMAKEAMADSSKWQDVGSEFEKLFEAIKQGFDYETERMKGVIGALWDNPGDFVQADFCNSVATLADNLDESDDLTMDAAVAFIEDLGCFKNAFGTVENIDLEAMVGGVYTEREALEVIKGVYGQMHLIKQAGEDFERGMGELNAKIFGEDSEDSGKKRLLQRLLSMYERRK